MAYKGEDFVTGNTTVSVRVYEDGKVQISEFGHGKLSEESATELAKFLTDQLFQVRQDRGDFDRQGW